MREKVRKRERTIIKDHDDQREVREGGREGEYLCEGGIRERE